MGARVIDHKFLWDAEWRRMSRLCTFDRLSFEIDDITVRWSRFISVLLPPKFSKMEEQQSFLQMLLTRESRVRMRVYRILVRFYMYTVPYSILTLRK